MNDITYTKAEAQEIIKKYPDCCHSTTPRTFLKSGEVILIDCEIYEYQCIPECTCKGTEQITNCKKPSKKIVRYDFRYNDLDDTPLSKTNRVPPPIKNQ